MPKEVSDKKTIYFMDGKVNVQMTAPGKWRQDGTRLPSHWMKMDFPGTVVSGYSAEEAAKELTNANIFVSKEDKWRRDKEIRIISYNVISELGKVNY